MPNLEVALYTFTGAMINSGRTPPGYGPGQHTADGGDPVDLGTGLFVMEKTDLAIQDVIPLALTRTYRPQDHDNRPFGIGTTHAYGIFLWSADQWDEVDLVLPAGSKIHYPRISPGIWWQDAVFEPRQRPGRSTSRGLPGTGTAGT